MSGLGMTTPCSACKLLRRRCAAGDCVFAPYFPPHEPQKFASVHKIYGASNLSKMLKSLPVQQRAEAVNSLVYQANAWVNNPVYGCVAAILDLQHQLARVRTELAIAKAELLRNSVHQPTTLVESAQGNGSCGYHPQYQQQSIVVEQMGIGEGEGMWNGYA